MKTHKTVFRYYTIMEYEKEQEWLSRQHRQGWKLTAAAVCFYRFERCAPEDVVYQLDYNPEGREHQEEYVQLFRDCGWEHVLDNVGYSYFRKPAAQMQGREEIFCDEASRMEMFRRILCHRMLPLLILLVGMFVPLPGRIRPLCRNCPAMYAGQTYRRACARRRRNSSVCLMDYRPK